MRIPETKQLKNRKPISEEVEIEGLKTNISLFTEVLNEDSFQVRYLYDSDSH